MKRVKVLKIYLERKHNSSSLEDEKPEDWPFSSQEDPSSSGSNDENQNQERVTNRSYDDNRGEISSFESENDYHHVTSQGV